MNGTFKAVERWQSHQLRCPKDLDELLRGFRPLFAYHDHLLEGREIPLATVEEFFKTGAVSQFSGDPKDLRQHRTIAEASAVESPIRQETIGFPAHFFARAHNFKPPGRACQPEADSPMRT